MLKVRIAETPEQLEHGLMFVQNMPSDEGMLFVFKHAQKLSFWGRNTFIPLDIAFIDRNMVIRKIDRIKPHCLSSVSSGISCQMALEVNSGYFEKNQIKTGDRMDIDFNSRITVSKKEEPLIPIQFISTHFNKGHFASIEKDIISELSNFKQGQVNDLPEVPVVRKKDEKTVGEPIGPETHQQFENPDNLPVLDVSDIGNKLEDSFDEVTEDENKPEGEQSSPTEQIDTGLLQENLSSPTEREIAIEEEKEKQEPQVPQETKQYPIFESPYQAVSWAEQNSEVVRMSYITRHGRQLTRDIEPHGQFHSKSTHRQILVTFDETVGDVRAFIISNIQDWSFVGRQFQKKFVVHA